VLVCGSSNLWSLAKAHNLKRFKILEVGFGLGLHFVDALRAWIIKNALEVHKLGVILALASKKDIEECTEHSNIPLHVMEHQCWKARL
jgi:hypothetical protein